MFPSTRDSCRSFIPIARSQLSPSFVDVVLLGKVSGKEKVTDWILPLEKLHN